jgi:transposase
MGQGNFTEDFKVDAIKQITERGHSVADVSKRLGVITHSLYSWMKRLGLPRFETRQKLNPKLSNKLGAIQ